MEKMSTADLEKEAILNPEKAARRKKDRIRRTIVASLGTVCTIFILSFAALFVVSAMGKSHIMSKAESEAPVIASDLMMMDTAEQWQDDWIGYDGKIYAYNKDIMTFMVAVIDKKGDSNLTGTSNLANAIFLVVLNPHTRQTQIIAVNHDTITDVDIYGTSGAYSSTVKAPVGFQFAYADGRSRSAQLLVKTVSGLMHDLPVHGYYAVSMDSIPDINDAVGGVEITCLQDLSAAAPALKSGETLRLDGTDALIYVRYRDKESADGTVLRLERQNQYLLALVDQFKAAFKEDRTLPLTLFGRLNKSAVTDIAADEITYLATRATSYTLDESIYTLAGESRRGEEYDEFYPDENALQQLILRIFYEEVKR